MIKKIYFTVAVLFVAVLSLCAQTGITVNGIHYLCNPQNNTASVYGYDGIKPTGDLVIPATVTMNGKVYQVTSVGKTAFLSCDKITSVNLPNYITAIEERAFVGCSSLSLIKFPTSLTLIGYSAFIGCDKILTIHLSSTSLKTIEAHVFNGCRGLKSIKMPNTLREIKEGAFVSCSSLESIDLSICTSLISIGKEAFIFCHILSFVDLSKCTNLSVLEESVFFSCRELKKIKLPNSLLSIEKKAFWSCEKLVDIDLSQCNHLIYIGEDAFYSCKLLEMLEFPSSLVSFGEFAFYNCLELSVIIYNGEIEPQIGKGAFERSPQRVLYLPNATGDFIASRWGDNVTIEYGKTPSFIKDNRRSKYKIRGVRGAITIESAEGCSFRIYSLTGILISQGVFSSNFERVAVPSSELFLVCIENSAEKVICL